jgi:DNA-binding transcriptional regulator YhcF (GntR family)
LPGYGCYLVQIDRGQTCHSVRFLATKWNWHPSKVVRFLDRLKTEAMIETDAKQGVSVITICKYSEYQKVGLPEKQPTETVADTPPEQQRNREETGETVKQEDKNPSGRDASVTVLPVKSPEAKTYELGKTVLGKSAGGMVTNLRRASNWDDELAIQILTEASEKADPKAWVVRRIKSLADGTAYRGMQGVNDDMPRLKTKADREYEAWEARYFAGVH